MPNDLAKHRILVPVRRSSVMKKFLLFLFVLLAIIAIWLLRLGDESYRTYSPDKQYSVYAKRYSWERFVTRFPGGGGDASGIVFLYDEVQKKVIGKAKISMVSNTSSIEWSGNKAYFVGDDYPSIVDPWKLPRPISSSR